MLIFIVADSRRPGLSRRTHLLGRSTHGGQSASCRPLTRGTRRAPKFRRRLPGSLEELPRYLDQDLLVQMWPVLRTLVGRTVWEDAFPQLASRTRAAA
jgi:hypothetical protein